MLRLGTKTPYGCPVLPLLPYSVIAGGSSRRQVPRYALLHSYGQPAPGAGAGAWRTRSFS
jgi:hypothetical protein